MTAVMTCPRKPPRGRVRVLRRFRTEERMGKSRFSNAKILAIVTKPDARAPIPKG